jgi:methionyl aminopeptidase
MIKLKTKEEIKLLRIGGKKLSQILNKVGAQVKPGVTTEYLNNMAEKLIIEAGGRPSFKNYQTGANDLPYPTTLCTSINDEVVHAPAIPGRILRAGDIIGLDIGMEFPYSKDKAGLYTDMAITFPVGRISPEAEKLLAVTKKSLWLAIKRLKPGMTINDIGGIIEDYVEPFGYGIVRQLVGHGVGYKPHEDPQVPNYRAGRQYDKVLQSGLVIAIEPMINIGGWEIETADDDFTIQTTDGSLSAHFEHSIALTDKGALVLTA